MANQNGRLPIQAGRELCDQHKLTQVVVIGRTVAGTQVCMTYGVTQKDCENAAVAGKFWERVIALGTKCEAVKAIRDLLHELTTKDS